MNDEGSRLTISSDDRTLAQSYPRSSQGFQFNIHASTDLGVEATIPFLLKFYELEVLGVGKERFPTLTDDL